MNNTIIKHKVFTREYLEFSHMNKRQLLKIMSLEPETTVDYALPQQWLNKFSKETKLDYHLVLSTTFYAYPKGYSFGMPISGCIEVNDKINKWYAHAPLPVEVEKIKYVMPHKQSNEKARVIHALNVSREYINAMEALLIRNKIPLPSLPIETTMDDPLVLIDLTIDSLEE